MLAICSSRAKAQAQRKGERIPDANGCNSANHAVSPPFILIPKSSVKTQMTISFEQSRFDTGVLYMSYFQADIFKPIDR